MAGTVRTKEQAIDSNLASFLRVLPELMRDHRDEYALLRHGEPVAFYATAIDAQITGNQRFPDRLFSVQKVTDTAVELGFHAYAVHQRTP